MALNKSLITKITKIMKEDEVLKGLMSDYFKLYALENIGQTKKLTEKIDALEVTINNRIQELKDERASKKL